MAEKWISFDCYGTLIDWRTGLLAALEAAAPGYGARMLELHRQIEGDIESGSYQPYRDVLAKTLTQMAATVGAPLDPAHRNVLAESLPGWPLYPDTAGGLQALKEDGWKLAILSNVDNDLMHRTLPRLGVEIDHVVTAEDIRSYKPKPAHFQALLHQTGLDPDRWVHAAVNLEYDLIPASAFGAHTVWVNRESEPPTEFEPHATLSTVGEIPAAVRGIFGDASTTGDT
jgi:2-haloacid dehalogenase